MATITLKGKTIHTSGNLPETGSAIADFRLTTAELEDKTLADFAGKKKIINIVPSLDTGTCAASARTFDKEVARMSDTVCLTVSADLPFAAARFCKVEGIDNIVTLSQLRNRDFGRDYGVEMIDGPLEGLLSRAVIVTDADDRVVYTEQVPEIAQEPDYGAALAAIRSA